MAAFLLHRPRRHDMNQMEIFKNPEFGSIRTFEQDMPIPVRPSATTPAVERNVP